MVANSDYSELDTGLRIQRHEDKEVLELLDLGEELEKIEPGALISTGESKMQSKYNFFENFALTSGNRMISDDNAEDILRTLTTNADTDVCYTFREGKQVQYDSSATSIDVAIFYVPGADLADVNILENKEITQEKASQKSAQWRVLTAGGMLGELEVQRDLQMIRVDKTATVIAQHKANQTGFQPGAAMTDVINKSLMKMGDEKDKVVNIDSRNVEIRNAFSDPKVVDIECTCIEVDGQSLLNLIHNFRDLCSTQGKFARLSTEDTIKILEIMVEDARRLLVRSPILTRVAQRVVIQKSKNTRYGLDTGTMFHTFTTSKGIAEMIQQGNGYYSALQMAKEAQAKIRPKFMQMVVFLLSLLNDEDLARLQPALEQSYNLKADRKSIELTILKVLTYYAVGPHLFLTGVIGAFGMERVVIEDTQDSESRAWDKFLGETARLGWLLPGTVNDLGRKVDSWKLKWRKFQDSDVFDLLQYSREKDAVNYIPPMKIHSEGLASLEVSAEFQNGQTYNLAAKDLDDITLAVRNRYTVTHADTKLQSDLVVVEEVLFKELDSAAIDLQHICNKVNEQTQFSTEISQKKSSIRLPKGLKRQSREPQPFFGFKKPVGLRTKNTIIVISGEERTEDVIAISWKLNGRKTTYKDLVRGVGADLNAMLSTCASLKEFGDQQKTQAADPSDYVRRKQFEQLAHNIELVNLNLKASDNIRRKMMNSNPAKDDEPILRVHFPGQVHSKQDLPMVRYNQGYTPDSWQLCISSERYSVTEDPKWVLNVAHLELGNGQKVTAMPLTEVDPEERDLEIEKGDVVLLLGGLIAVVTANPGGDKVVNFLKLTSLSRVRRRRRGGGDDEGPVALVESILV